MYQVRNISHGVRNSDGLRFFVTAVYCDNLIFVLVLPSSAHHHAHEPRTGTKLNAVALPLPVILSQHLHAKANILPPSRIRGREIKSKNYDGTR